MPYEPKKAVILIIKDGCEACRNITSLIGEHIMEGKVVVYRVFQSRIKNMWEIRAVDQGIEGFPTLLSSDQIYEVPVLYDPVLEDMLVGEEEIEEYLSDTGLI